MDFPQASAHETTQADPAVPVVALASALAFVAAASLLVWSLFPSRKRTAAITGQVALGVLAGSTAVVVWNRRQEEADAARHLMTHIHEVRDTRWLKKHPIAYG
jgi:uncharacterized membrane protein YqjE